MVFYEGAYPDFREDGMSLHISLWEKYTAIREDSVYKLQNVEMYDQIFSKLCSGEGNSMVGAMRLDCGAVHANHSVIKVAKR